MAEATLSYTERDGFKLLGEHIEGCHAAQDEDGLTFVITDDRPFEFSRKRNGDRGGSTMWWRFRCNTLACDAVLLVRWDVLARFINGVDT